MADVKISQQHASRPPPADLGINVEKPKYPQYAVYSKRIESFELWPECLPVGREDMVEAGLVYTGVGDSVRCYFCGGGLRNWEIGDVPMEEHAKWYPKCPHVLLVKGHGYIEKITRGEKPETDGSYEIGCKQDSVDAINHIETAAAQSCIEMGFSKDIVAKAIQIYIRKNGNIDFKGRDLCEIIFDIEENPQEQENAIDDQNATIEYTEKDNQAVTEDEQLEPLQTLIEENQRLKETQMCKIAELM